MKNIIHHQEFGEIIYNESFWTGKKSISIDGQQAIKINKTLFRTQHGDDIMLNGNYFKGVKATLHGQTIELLPPLKWYEIIFAILPFILNIIWGNSVALCSILLIAGGAIGGLISGLFTAINLFAMRSVRQIWLKLLIAICLTAASFFGCHFIALAILGLA